MLAALADADLVLGSRYVPGGTVVNWPWHRLLLSSGGNTYARLALGVPLRDITGGYRAFRSETLPGWTSTGVESQGYCFQVDLAWRAVRGGFRVVEVPDHVRRARARHQQDERERRPRGAVAGHRVGRAQPYRRAAFAATRAAGTGTEGRPCPFAPS